QPKKNLSSEFTWLLFTTNLAAAIAGFIASEPSKNQLPRLCALFGLCAAITALVAILWWCIGVRDSVSGTTSISNTVSSPGKPGMFRLWAVGFIIAVATLFWIGFELRSLGLNQLAKDRLSSETFGLALTPINLQSVN